MHVDDYRRQPPDTTPRETEPGANTAVEDAGRFLRRLIPFSSPADASALQTPLVEWAQAVLPQGTAPASGVPAAAEQAATVVSQAASILDAEMAKGVIAARGAAPPVRAGEGDPTSVLNQVHAVMDNIARLWPALQAASPRPPGAPSAGSVVGGEQSLPTVKPRAAVRPGESGTITMLLCNRENRTVRLAAAATDLISSTGGRITSTRLEFVPGEVRLQPGEEIEIQGHIAVPADSAPGHYAG